MTRWMQDTFAPTYYRGFRCIADRCRHSCCVDWEIGIDVETMDKYKHLEHILKTVEDGEDGPQFSLREDGRCPHLRDDGLCHIICTHGEDFLCEICQKHPRFFNRVGKTRTEAGLGIVCEEACRLILTDKTPFSLVKIEEGEGTSPHDSGYDPLPERDRILETVCASEDFEKTLETLKTTYRIPTPYTPERWLSRFLSLEILEADWERDLQAVGEKFLQTNAQIAAQYGNGYARLLGYFVYRHVSVATSEENLRARLGFALLSTAVIRSLFEQNTPQTLEQLIDWARRYSAEIEYSADNTDELIFAFEATVNSL